MHGRITVTALVMQEKTNDNACTQTARHTPVLPAAMRTRWGARCCITHILQHLIDDSSLVNILGRLCEAAYENATERRDER